VLSPLPNHSLPAPLAVVPSGKLVLLDKLLPKLQSEGHRVLIFSQMVRMLDLLEDYCRVRGFTFERLDGSIRGAQRQNAIGVSQHVLMFQPSGVLLTALTSSLRMCRRRPGRPLFKLQRARVRVLIVHACWWLGHQPDCCRHGTPWLICFIQHLVAYSPCLEMCTLRCGQCQVIIFDSDFNPQNDRQAMARCHRIGQTQHVKVYRLLTNKTYEATMFERASQKLGLEHAVLGGDVSSLAESAAGANPVRSADELQRLLRLGAYAVLMETSGHEADDATKVFMESNIEELLVHNTRTVEVSDTGVGFGTAVTKSKFAPAMSDVDIDVNADDFWERVLPGFQSASKLLLRLQDDDGPLQLLAALRQDVASRRKAQSIAEQKVESQLRRKYKEGRDDFFSDVSSLVDYLTDSTGQSSADMEQIMSLGKSEVALSIKLLTVMTTMADTFTEVRCRSLCFATASLFVPSMLHPCERAAGVYAWRTVPARAHCSMRFRCSSRSASAGWSCWRAVAQEHAETRQPVVVPQR
jgi:hypothetical protein